MAIDKTKPLFTIRIAAQQTGLHSQTIRKYEARGLLEPFRSDGGTRFYSEKDIERLLEIGELSGLGVNLEGVERILDLEAEVERLESVIDSLLSERAWLKGELHKARLAAQMNTPSVAIILHSEPLPPIKVEQENM